MALENDHFDFSEFYRYHLEQPQGCKPGIIDVEASICFLGRILAGYNGSDCDCRANARR